MKNSGGCMELSMLAGVIAIFACALFGIPVLLSAGARVLPAEQVSQENLKLIQPKGVDAEEDGIWMQGDADIIRAQGQYLENAANATVAVANAPVGLNPNNDGNFAVGIVAGVIIVILIIAVFIMSVGRGRV